MWRLLFGLGVFVVLGSCVSHHFRHLSRAELHACVAKGGHASRAPFGSPICEVPFADADKACTGKADCQGRCLKFEDGSDPRPQLGDRVTGACEASDETFGCYGRVEGGIFVEDLGCEG